MTTGKNLFGAAMLTTLVLGLVGCGGGGGTPVTEASFCMRKAEAECQVSERCVSDKTMCLAERMTMCTQFAAAAKAGGKRVFTPGNVDACVNKTTSVYAKTAAITPQELADMLDLCNYVFQGDGETLTDPCDVKYDCAGKVICDKGFCATTMTKGADQPCSDPGAVCSTGNYCTMNSASLLVCTAKAMTGATCSATTPCLEALRCSAGTCTDRVAASMPCTSNDDCATAAPYCDPSAGNRCTTGLLFAPLSPSCADYGGTTGAGGSGGGAAGTTGTAGGGAAGTTGTAGGGAAGTGGSGGGGAAGTTGTAGGGAAGSGGSGGGGTAGTGGSGGGAAGTGP
jgi:hypothetical protein